MGPQGQNLTKRSAVFFTFQSDFLNLQVDIEMIGPFQMLSHDDK